MSTNPTAPRRPGRRRLRVSIGALCLVVAAVALGLAWTTNEARRQRRAIEAIKALNGTYHFDYEFVGGDPRATEIPGAKPPGPAWLRRWIGDEPFRDVVQVVLSGDRVKDDDLALLEDLPRLRFVMLYRTMNITDAGLSHLRGQRRLLSLNVHRNPRIGDAGLAHVRDLTALEDLFFDGHPRRRRRHRPARSPQGPPRDRPRRHRDHRRRPRQARGVPRALEALCEQHADHTVRLGGFEQGPAGARVQRRAEDARTEGVAMRDLGRFRAGK